MPYVSRVGRATRVLVVDVHPLRREGVCRRIEEDPALDVAGEAATEAEAFEALERVGADVVVLDDAVLCEGDGSGEERLQRMAAVVGVVVLSEGCHRRDVTRALRAGARGYVLKRSSAERLMEAIRAIATGGTFLDDGVASLMLHHEELTPQLTARESEVLQFIGLGTASKTIARELNISVRTVESHRQSLRRKLGIVGQAALIKYAVEQGASGGARRGDADA